MYDESPLGQEQPVPVTEPQRVPIMSAERSTKLALEAEVRQLRQRIAGLEQECQQQFLASLLAHAPYGVSVCKGRELRYELVNPAYQEMVGPDIPLVGRRYSEIFPEAAAAGAEARLLEVIDTAEPWIISGFKAPIPGKPDATWAGQVVCLPAATDGEPALLSIVWDVTEQVGANEARRDIEARFRALVTSTSDVVFQSDGDRTGSSAFIARVTFPIWKGRPRPGLRNTSTPTTCSA